MTEEHDVDKCVLTGFALERRITKFSIILLLLAIERDVVPKYRSV